MQADRHDAPNAKSIKENEKAALVNIVAKYNISDADMSALMDWKHKAF
jgi:hypothetical protein